MKEGQQWKRLLGWSGWKRKIFPSGKNVARKYGTKMWQGNVTRKYGTEDFLTGADERATYFPLAENMARSCSVTFSQFIVSNCHSFKFSYFMFQIFIFCVSSFHIWFFRFSNFMFHIFLFYDPDSHGVVWKKEMQHRYYMGPTPCLNKCKTNHEISLTSTKVGKTKWYI